MSLLIDALKKAEREKKAANEHWQGVVEENREHTQIKRASASEQRNQENPRNDGILTQGLSIEDGDAHACPEQDQQVAKDEQDHIFGASGLTLLPVEEEFLPADPWAEDSELASATTLESEITSSGVSVDKDLLPYTDPKRKKETATKEVFDGDMSGQYGYFSETVSSVQLAQDLGGGTIPVVAQTEFISDAIKPKNTVLLWFVFISLCLLIAATLPFYIFNYTLPTERSIKFSVLAKDVEEISESGLVIEEAKQRLSKNVVYDNSLLTGASANFTAEEDSFFVNPEEVSENTVLPEEIVLDQKLIKISHSSSKDGGSLLLVRAYEKYLVSDYVAAEKDYLDVLEKLPDNRDALLGLAAIAQKKGAIRQAYMYYLALLKYYPRDNTAEAALINLQAKGDYVRNISVLKTLIKKKPDNPFLHYSLGHLYASRQRWPEAQQAFFNAYVRDNSNPDYAYNLAVSLDHINQPQAAIDYYNVALDKASQSVTSFDSAAVSSRIVMLSSLHTSR